jgi:hypothetical protein
VDHHQSVLAGVPQNRCRKRRERVVLRLQELGCGGQSGGLPEKLTAIEHGKGGAVGGDR